MLTFRPCRSNGGGNAVGTRIAECSGDSKVLAKKTRMIKLAACFRAASSLFVSPSIQDLPASQFRNSTHTVTYGIGHNPLALVVLTLSNGFAAKAQVQQLRAVTGYSFKSQELLKKAVSVQKKDYQALAYLGDAVIRILYQEEAFQHASRCNKLDNKFLTPNMSVLLSGDHFAAVATHQWRLHELTRDHHIPADLIKQTRQQAENLEAIAGAMLLESDHDTVSKRLQPWVTAASDITRQFEAAKQQEQQQRRRRRKQKQQDPTEGLQQKQHNPLLDALIQHYRTNANTAAARRKLSKRNFNDLQHIQQRFQAINDTQQSQQQQPLTTLIEEQLRERCKYRFQNQNILDHCSRLMWHMYIPSGATQDTMQEGRTWQKFGNCVQEYAAKHHSCHLHFGTSSSTDSSEHGCNVQEIIQTVEKLTSEHHRASVLQWLCLDPASWCPQGSSFRTLTRDEQLQAVKVSGCLSLLLTAVYLDGGMKGALAVADTLLRKTEPNSEKRRRRRRRVDVQVA